MDNEDPTIKAERKKLNKEKARKDQERREQKERAREILEQQLVAKPVAITNRFATAGASATSGDGDHGTGAAAEDAPV